MELKGQKVILVPIKPEDKEEFYQLATQTYGSRFWYDQERKSRRSQKEFFTDWHDGYFDTDHPETGQCFWVMVDDKKIGQVNYNRIDQTNKKTELDIIIGPKEYLGKGYGTDALKTLITYLFNNFNLNKVWIEARANTPRAIRAYKKIGFIKEGLLREESYFGGKFVDCIRFGLLRQEFKHNDITA